MSSFQTANLWKSRMEVYVHDEQTPEGLTQGERLMRIRLAPQVSTHFVSILNIARNLHLDYGFSVIWYSPNFAHYYPGQYLHLKCYINHFFHN